MSMAVNGAGISHKDMMSWRSARGLWAGALTREARLCQWSSRDPLLIRAPSLEQSYLTPICLHALHTARFLPFGLIWLTTEKETKYKNTRGEQRNSRKIMGNRMCPDVLPAPMVRMGRDRVWLSPQSPDSGGGWGQPISESDLSGCPTPNPC